MLYTKPRMAHPSFLHRLFGFPPGKAPELLYSKDRCMGLDVPLIIPVELVFAGFLVATHVKGWLSLSFLVLAILFVKYVSSPFEKCERLGRARRRRCVRCGEKSKCECRKGS